MARKVKSKRDDASFCCVRQLTVGLIVAQVAAPDIHGVSSVRLPRLSSARSAACDSVRAGEVRRAGSCCEMGHRKNAPTFRRDYWDTREVAMKVVKPIRGCTSENELVREDTSS